MFTAHEVRTIIRNCNTLHELQQVEFQILIQEAHEYSIIIMYAFEAALLKQKLKLSNKYPA